MSEVVLSEIIEDMDVDLDGQVSIEEYIADIINEGDDNTIQESERDNFNNNLDVDQNGQLSRDEVSFYKHLRIYLYYFSVFLCVLPSIPDFICQ